MKIGIDQIKVQDRIRTQLGDVDELAENLQQHGLIHPISVCEDKKAGCFRLVTGERRLTAAKKLGWTEIEANLIADSSPFDLVKLEIAENVQRKAFCFSEKMCAAKKLEAGYKALARKNMSDGGKGVMTVAPLGRVDDQVAKDVGFGSGNTYRQAKYIVDHCTAEVIGDLDRGERSISSTYSSVKSELKIIGDVNKGLIDVREVRYFTPITKEGLLALEQWKTQKSSENHITTNPESPMKDGLEPNQLPSSHPVGSTYNADYKSSVVEATEVVNATDDANADAWEIIDPPTGESNENLHVIQGFINCRERLDQRINDLAVIKALCGRYEGKDFSEMEDRLKEINHSLIQQIISDLQELDDEIMRYWPEP